MEIITGNKKISDLINHQKRPDGQIIPGVFIAMSYDVNTRQLINLFVGTKQSGPMLQFNDDGSGLYSGRGRDLQDSHFPDGGWTNAYSNGNYGKNYSHGGTWSGHTKSLHPSIAVSWDGTQGREDIETELIGIGDSLEPLPYGIKGDITQIDLDCSGSWAIWHNTAHEALSARLTVEQLRESSLPDKAKKHLIPNEAASLELLWEFVNLYDL